MENRGELIFIFRYGKKKKETQRSNCELSFQRNKTGNVSIFHQGSKSSRFENLGKDNDHESRAIFTRVEKIIGEFHLGDNEGSLGGGRERAPGGGS